MPLFDHWPYVDLSKLNLDWILEVVEKANVKLQDLSKEITAAVYSWLDAHPEATTTVQDGSLTRQKFTPGLQESITWINGINKEITLPTTWLGHVGQAGSLQAMASDGTYLYAVSTNGNDQHPVIWKLDPADLTIIDQHTLSVYGHPNGMDFCDGYLYIAGCEPNAVNASTYKYITKVNVTNWNTTITQLPMDLAMWSVCLLRAYNGKVVLAGHRPETSILELYATIYAGSSAVLGQDKFMPWQCLDLGPFSCDPADISQYGNYILIGDAHLSGSVANNAVRVFDSMGGHKATIYMPEMEELELEGVCMIGNAMYTCDAAGNIYRTSISEAVARSFDPDMFAHNDRAGVQFAYMNENGSEIYAQEGTAYLLTSFRLIPFYQFGEDHITNGLMRIKTWNNGRIDLKPNVDANGNLIFSGTGHAGSALASYYIRYNVSTPADNDEYLYTLYELNVTTHYQGNETVYTTFADAVNAGYFTGYTYVENLISEATVKYSNTAIQL